MNTSPTFTSLILILFLTKGCSANVCGYDYNYQAYFIRSISVNKAYICTNSTWDNTLPELGNILPYHSTAALTLNNFNFQSLPVNDNIRRIINNIRILRIKNNSFLIKDDAFYSFGGLRAIQIYESNLSNVDFKGFDLTNVYSNENIYHLVLSKTNLNSITEICNKHGNLKSLNITENDIRVIKLNTLSKCVNLEDLNLSNNMIDTIETNSFKDLHRLENIDLRGNNFTKITADFFLGLSGITNLDLSNYNLDILEPGAFNGMFKLQNLNVSNNKIKELDGYTFNQTGDLNILDLSNNFLDTLQSNAFFGLRHLYTLKWNPLKLDGIKKDSFQGLSSITSFDLSNLNVKSIDSGAFNGLYEIKNLSLSFNNLTKLKVETFNQTHNLILLNISNNVIAEIDKGAFDGLDNLEYLHLKENKITYFHCDFIRHPFDKLQFLNLSYNEISKIDVCALKHFEKLTVLDLSHNKISTILLGTFSSLNLLQKLNISDNFLTQIDAPLIFPLIELNTLDVSSNNLLNWNVRLAISHIRTLTHIELSNNTWDCNYLTGVWKMFYHSRIDIKPRNSRVLHEENINGIKCSNMAKNKSYYEKLSNNSLTNNIDDKNRNISQLMKINSKISETLEDLKNFIYNQYNSTINFLEVQKQSEISTSKEYGSSLKNDNLNVDKKFDNDLSGYIKTMNIVLIMIFICLLISCATKIFKQFLKYRNKNMIIQSRCESILVELDSRNL